jgi:hypothetical protein
MQRDSLSGIDFFKVPLYLFHLFLYMRWYFFKNCKYQV